MNTIVETFIKNFYTNGHNLFAIVYEYKGHYHAQFGHTSKKYKTKENALLAYNNFLKREQKHAPTF